MKAKNIVIIIIVLVLGLAACTNKNEGDNSVVGKWQEVKVRTYFKSYSGAISNDTTYTSAAFDTTDYALFNSGNTCVLSNHHVYEPTGASLTGSTVAYVSKQSYNYALVGFKYVMTIPTTLTNPGGFGSTDTASVNVNTLLIHSVFDSHINYTVTDAYYTR